MLFRTRNDELTTHREHTYLTAAVAVGDTTLTVQGVDANAWADDDYIIVGEIGTKTAEILRIAATTSDGTSLTVTQTAKGVADSDGARYAHSVDEPVYRIDYNQIEFSYSATATGTKTVLSATEEIQPDDLFTRYEDADSDHATYYGFVRFRNGSTYSEYSDAIPYTGYTAQSLGRMIKMVRRHLDEPDFRQLPDEDIIEELNEKQRDIAHERLWPFYEDIFSDSTIANTRQYDINTHIADAKIHAITVRSEPLAKIDKTRDDMLHWDTARTGEPTHMGIWDNDIILWPTPPDAAETDALDGDITASATTILLEDNSGFQPQGRIIIGSEVISYTNMNISTALDGSHTAAVTTITVDSTTGFPSAGTITICSEDITYTGTTATTFTGCTRSANSTTAAAYTDGETVSATTLNGCKRGLEDTTAATHDDEDVVTARDIIYSGHREPKELTDIGDETKIPDPLVLVYGSAMELALGKLSNPGLHDRMKIKYDEAISRLRNKFGRKGTAGYYKIKDKDEVVSDAGMVNPNDYPSGITD